MENKLFSEIEQKMLADIIAHRRDVRGNNFLNTPIPSESLRAILTAAQHAPSVGLSQPWEFVLIQNEQTKKQIVDSFQIENEKAKKTFTDEKQQIYSELKLEGIKESPINVAVFYKPSTQPVLGQNSMPEMGEYSVVCAIQNMWLTARALNIGLGWVSILDPEKVKSILNAPKEHKLVAYLCLGYVKTFYTKPELEHVKWEKQKPLTLINEQYC